jgi:hypothetical protein
MEKAGGARHRRSVDPVAARRPQSRGVRRTLGIGAEHHQWRRARGFRLEHGGHAVERRLQQTESIHDQNPQFVRRDLRH